jgi:DNA-directed RNA polymerase specialized sigma24 family protein
MMPPALASRRARTWRTPRLPRAARRSVLFMSDQRRKPPSRASRSAPPVPPEGAPPAPPVPPEGAPPAPPPGALPSIDRDTALDAMRFYPAILGWMRRCGVPPREAPDVAIDVVIRALKRWAAFVAPDEQHAAAARRMWLFVIAYREAAAWCKSDAARLEPHDPREMAALAEKGEQHASPEETMIDQEEQSERAAEVELGALCPETSSENWRAFVAHEVEGVPVAVIADLEGVPIATIYTRLRFARRDLRAAILRLRARVAFEKTTAIRRGKR